MITHNLGVVAEICDRVGVMYAGYIAEIGSTYDIFKKPMHPYTQGLIGKALRDEFIAYKSEEWDAYHLTVSRWETERYSYLF